MYPSQEQLLEAAIHNNSLSIAGPDKTPGVPLFIIPDNVTVNDLNHLSQECKVIPKQEPRAQLKIEDDKSVEDDNNPEKYQFGNLTHTEKLGSTTN